MTYKTRQEVLRAAADWMDVCEKAGVIGEYRVCGITNPNSFFDGTARPESYEFPLALLEGKEVWVGSEVYIEDGRKLKVVGAKNSGDILILDAGSGYECCPHKNYVSWNPPKPKTVMVELPMRLVEFRAGRIELNNDEHDTLLLAEDDACKKALEKL